MNSTIVLKLYAFGIARLHDPNWTGLELYDRLKQHIRGRLEPTNMLYATIRKGLLFHIGKWVFEDYLENENRFESDLDVKGEYLLWYLEDYVDFLLSLGIRTKSPSLTKAENLLDSFYLLYQNDEPQYFETLDSADVEIKELLIEIGSNFQNEISAQKGKYSQDFAERAFHDRMLCELISNLVVQIGFDGDDENTGAPKQWVKRKPVPIWAKNAIIARDRGNCAQCGRPLIQELNRPYHFDHILPLYHGGSNDLSNFQLLCDECNLRKSKSKRSVLSSVPRYLQKIR